MTPRRLSVVGTSGSGKTTLAAAVAARLGVTHLELDAVFHQPGWRPLPDDAFRAAVAGVVAGDGWVADGNYSTVRSLIWERADTVVWLDYPKGLVMRRLVGRTLRRLWRREELWNGNRERGYTLLDPRPARNIVLWGWTRHRTMHHRYEAAMADPTWAHLTFVRLRTPDEADAWVASLPARPPS